MYFIEIGKIFLLYFVVRFFTSFIQGVACIYLYALKNNFIIENKTGKIIIKQ